MVIFNNDNLQVIEKTNKYFVWKINLAKCGCPAL